ncbi:unnamed protein product [Rhizoctonia solani]|uniref:Uncharacterized protein n=1 Tax=Rhizoctonia solani TaxID=456999 RepID=A0A8H2X5V7_9AGAM|nr:unnamed protein product [Rhizoctonia solani]
MEHIAAPVVIDAPRYPGASAIQFWKTCTWGWGCYNGTWTDALRNNASEAANITNGLPLRFPDNSSPTVIDVDYVCPVYQIKRTGSFLVAVFVGTFSMYTALVGVFMSVAPIFDERYRRKHDLIQEHFVEEENVLPLARSYQRLHPLDSYTAELKASDSKSYSTSVASRSYLSTNAEKRGTFP